MKKLRKFNKLSGAWLGYYVVREEPDDYRGFHLEVLDINIRFSFTRALKMRLTHEELLAKIHSSAPQGD